MEPPLSRATRAKRAQACPAQDVPPEPDTFGWRHDAKTLKLEQKMSAATPSKDGLREAFSQNGDDSCSPQATPSRRANYPREFEILDIDVVGNPVFDCFDHLSGDVRPFLLNASPLPPDFSNE